MKTQKVGFVFYQGFTPLQIAVAGAFDVANRHAGRTIYEVRVLSKSGGPLRGPIGVSIDSEPFSDALFDLLIVCGGPVEPEPDIVAFLRGAPQRSRRIASVCTGAFALAAAGLLEGRSATTHWGSARLLQERYPAIKVEENRIFMSDGPIWTCAGSTAGLDLALAFIEEDFGIDLARTIARFFVMYHRRSGGQTQYSTLLELEPKSDRIQKVVTYARRHLTNRLSIDELAEVANLSPRQFSRIFQEETGQSPARAVENLRVEAARILMEDSDHPIEAVAQQTGFGDSGRMRRAFIRAFGQSPQVIRHATHGATEPDAGH
ncbi:GlxA family transcriptional regulator [Burkholderia sp. 22PA0099]|uniref:GlxA family transcriptional regulator n=1 Tax=Burkholderia sp. 22PA0099 TaxID=3237372 RepID=UPI0039C06DD7